APLITFRCRDRNDLYKAAREVNWPELFAVEHTFGLFANVSGNRKLKHSKFAALCVKDAIADCFRDACGQRPDVNRADPDLWLNLYVENEQGTISLDTSGGSLHRRGYRRESVEAPMQETLAAAMVAFSGWQGAKPLVDPMCGSGTLLCEALMQQCAVPAGFLRKKFGFQLLPDFDAARWRQVKAAADAKIRPLKTGAIAGSDIDATAVKAARANCRQLPGGEAITITRADLLTLPGFADTVLMINPPYGLRLDQDPSLPTFYKSLGDFLKRRCTGSEAYIYFGNRELLKHIGLRPAWKKPLHNAQLDGRLAKFELY
ncbi:MAG: THUMP domain-containing protein, partial [Desulfobacteraceae bacterium]|nr:THUMP domain-containing protein [Desulfobacteraceae bacterium]